MKRTFVLLITTIIHVQLSYAQKDVPAVVTPPALSSELPKTLGAPPVAPQTSDILLHAQLKVPAGTVLASEMSGRISRFMFSSGAHFTAGQVLANLSCTKQAAKLAKVRTALEQQNQIKQQLVAMHSINTLEIDLANSEREEALADVQVAEALLARCSVYAPFSGRVVKLLAKSAQLVQPGDPLMEIIDENNQEVELLLSSREMLAIKPGQHYQINTDDKAAPYTVELINLGGRIDAVNQTVKAYGRIEMLISMQNETAF